MTRGIRASLLPVPVPAIAAAALLTVAWSPAHAAGSKWLPIGVAGTGGAAVSHTMLKNMGKWKDTFREVAGSVDATGRGHDRTLDRIDATLRDAQGSVVREAFPILKIPDKIKRGLTAVRDKIAGYASGDTGTSALAIDPEDRVHLKRSGVIGSKPLPSVRLKPPPGRAAKSGSPRSPADLAAREPWGASPKKASWDEPDPWADPPVTDPDAATVDAWAQNCIGLKEKPSSKSADFMLFKQMREEYIRKHGTADCAPAGQGRAASGAGSGEPRESYGRALARALGDDPRATDGSYTDALDAVEKAEREREAAAARERELARQRELAAARERELARQREQAAARERELARQREQAAARERELARQRELRRQREQAAAWEREAEAERRREEAEWDAQVRALQEQAARNRAQDARDLAEGLVNMLNAFSSSGQEQGGGQPAGNDTGCAEKIYVEYEDYYGRQRSMWTCPGTGKR